MSSLYENVSKGKSKTTCISRESDIITILLAYLFMKYQLLAYLTLGGVLLTLGDIFFKKWAIDDKYIYY